MKVWKNMELQEIIDFVSSYPTAKQGCKALGLSQAVYSKVKTISNSSLKNKVDNGEMSLDKAYRADKDYLFSEDYSLSILSDKAKEEVGKVSSSTARAIRWGMIDVKSFIDHYETVGYGKKTQQKAIEAHYYLMYEGHQSNYLQLRGIDEEFRTIKLVYGSIQKKHREMLKQGIYCKGDEIGNN